MPPFQHESVLVPPSDVPQLQNTVQLNNPTLSPAGCRRSHATCPQSRQSWRFSRTRTRTTLPWLPQTSTPRRQASFSIILGAGLGLSDVVFSCGIKRMRAEKRAGLRSSAVSILRWQMLCFGCLMPSWTRAPAPSAFTACALR